MIRLRAGAHSAAGAIVGGASAVGVIIVLGRSAPDVMRGAQVLLIGGATGLLVASLVRVGWAPARIVGATVGGAAGAWFALTYVEWMEGFNHAWALHGGGYGLMFGVPIAAFIGGLAGFLRGTTPA